MPYHYKVVSQKKEGLIKKMKPEDLEKILNEQGRLGWKLDRIVSGEQATMLGWKDAFLIIFSRESNYKGS